MMDGSDLVAAELARRAKTQDEIRAAEAERAAQATTAGKPPLVYHVVRPVEHNGTRYEIGSTFRSPDADVIKALREAGCLVLPTELEPAEDVAATLARLEHERESQAAEAEALRARVAELEAAAAAAAKAAEKPAAKAAKGAPEAAAEA